MKLTLGFSNFNAPYHSGVNPFKDIFDEFQDLQRLENLQGIDAICLWGGTDISPSLYDEHALPNSGPKHPSQRDLYEWNIMRMAYDAKIPMIGVCRGLQMFCAFAGGKLVQHVNNHNSGIHQITTNDKREFSVTSAHHQMVYPYDIEHELLAWSTKPMSSVYEPNYKLYSVELEKRQVKEPEVVFFPAIKALGAQCHPEWHKNDDPFNLWFNDKIKQLLLEDKVCT